MTPLTPYIVSKAFLFARGQHEGQKYGERPYTEHLEVVVFQLRLFGHHHDPNLLAAGYLHDVVEDTTATVDILRSMFGSDIADLVGMVTDQPGHNRKERHQATYARLRGHQRATALKLADRLANVWNAYLNQSPLLKMYRKEQPEFKLALQVPGDCNDLKWLSLDSLFDYTRIREELCRKPNYQSGTSAPIGSSIGASG